MIHRLMADNVKQWNDTRTARTSISSQLAHDPAFMRLRPGVFALKPLLTDEVLGTPLPCGCTSLTVHMCCDAAWSLSTMPPLPHHIEALFKSRSLPITPVPSNVYKQQHAYLKP